MALPKMKPLASKPTMTSILSLAIWSENKSMSFLWASGLPNKAKVSLLIWKKRLQTMTIKYLKWILFTWIRFLVLGNLDTFWDYLLSTW